MDKTRNGECDDDNVRNQSREESDCGGDKNVAFEERIIKCVSACWRFLVNFINGAIYTGDGNNYRKGLQKNINIDRSHDSEKKKPKVQGGHLRDLLNYSDRF